MAEAQVCSPGSSLHSGQLPSTEATAGTTTLKAADSSLTGSLTDHGRVDRR